MNVNRHEVDTYAQKIWDYMHMHHEMKPTDAIIVLGSNDLRVATRAVELYKAGLAPIMIFCGGNGKISNLKRTEAETFADIASEHGVPRDVMYLDTESTNTGANLQNAHAISDREGLDIQSAILVSKPYMERRAYATARKQWPELDVIVTSQDIEFQEYAKELNSPAKDPHFGFIRTMVGDMERIREYPKIGYQVEQDIPDEVWEAWEKLNAMGFDLHKL